MFARILPKVGCDSSVCGYSTLIDFGMSEPTHLTSRFRCRRWSVKDITRRRRASGVGALCVSPLGPRVAARRRAGRWRPLTSRQLFFAPTRRGTGSPTSHLWVRPWSPSVAKCGLCKNHSYTHNTTFAYSLQSLHFRSRGWMVIYLLVLLGILTIAVATLK